MIRYMYIVLAVLFFQSGTLLSQECLVDSSGLKQGACTEYLINYTAIRKANYLNNKLHGPYEIRYEYSGGYNLIEKGHYFMGNRHGLVYEYGTRGKIRKVSNFKNGILDGTVTRFVKGHVSLIQSYQNGVANGLWQTFHKNGKPRAYFYCKDGVFGDVHHLNKDGTVEKIVLRQRGNGSIVDK